MYDGALKRGVAFVFRSFKVFVPSLLLSSSLSVVVGRRLLAVVFLLECLVDGGL